MLITLYWWNKDTKLNLLLQLKVEKSVIRRIIFFNTRHVPQQGGTKSHWLVNFFLACFFLCLFIQPTNQLHSLLQNFNTNTFCKASQPWESHQALTKMGSRKVHGRLKKIRNLLIIFRNMAMANGELFPRMLVYCYYIHFSINFSFFFCVLS